MRALAIAALLVPSFSLAADGGPPPDTEKVIVAAGGTKVVALQTTLTAPICDDVTIVRVDLDQAGTVKFTGLKAGQTQCSFTNRVGLPRRLFTVVVTGATEKPK
jgi:hypothetical protein